MGGFKSFLVAIESGINIPSSQVPFPAHNGDEETVIKIYAAGVVSGENEKRKLTFSPAILHLPPTLNLKLVIKDSGGVQPLSLPPVSPD